MNTRYFVAILVGLAIMASSQAREQPAAKAAAATETSAQKVKPEALMRTQCDVTASKQQCCGAKNCGGNVLSNRDAHNCGNTAGKSWHPASQNGGAAACSNL